MVMLYFVRHAESEANVGDILASRLDFGLSEKGLVDSRVIAGRLREMAAIDRVVSSPLRRAVQTAWAFADAYGVDVEIDDRLTEQELGDYAGMTYAELKTANGYEHDREKRWGWEPVGGGESYEMIARRVEVFFKEFDEGYGGDDVGGEEAVGGKGGGTLVVSHAVTMRLIRGLLENSLPRYPREIAENGEIWRVRYVGLGASHEVESIFLSDERTEHRA